MYGNNEFPGDAGAAVLTEDDVVEEHMEAQGDSLDPQVAAARIIRIGGIQPASIKARDWPAEFVRPKLEHLKAEVTRRDSSKKPGGYTADKCLAYLKTTEFPGELARDEQPTFDKCMQIAKKPAEAAEAEGEEQDEAVDGSAGLRWSAKKHVTKLVHAIVEHKESFLDRHKKKTWGPSRLYQTVLACPHGCHQGSPPALSRHPAWSSHETLPPASSASLRRRLGTLP
jgi:hypothetical protein